MLRYSKKMPPWDQARPAKVVETGSLACASCSFSIRILPPPTSDRLTRDQVRGSFPRAFLWRTILGPEGTLRLYWPREPAGAYGAGGLSIKYRRRSDLRRPLYRRRLWPWRIARSFSG